MGYLSRKKVGRHGIRFSHASFNDGTKENPQWNRHPTILIPLKNTDGEIQAIQHIRADGEKRIYGPKKGNFHIIGDILNSGCIYVAEGYATAASAYEVKGTPTVVAFDCGNLDPVIANLRKKYPKNPITILGDDDVETEGNPGRTKAAAAAKKYGCKVVFPKFPEQGHLPPDENGEIKRGKDWNDLHAHFGADEARRQLSELVDQKDPVFSQEELKKAVADNECGDAALFKKGWGTDYVYDPDEKSFYVWNGTSWSVDKDKTRYQTLETIATYYADEAERVSGSIEEGDKTGKRLLKDFRDRAKQLKTTRRMRAVLEMATVGSIESGGLTFRGAWDDYSGYLPCANGLIDLRTGNLIGSGRDKFIRNHSSLIYNPLAICPTFEKFILEIMGNIQDLIKFLQRLIGYAATGKVLEHIFIFFYGVLGRNGKGTLLRIILKVLGCLCREFPSELLLLQKNPPSSGTARPDLVHLQGARIAVFSEINKGRKIDSAALKNLSGGDTIAARSLFSNEIKNFSPSHTIFLQANHKPEAPADDVALWRRAVLIPFNTTFVDEPKLSHERPIDIYLEAKLEAELQGILRWIVEGAVEYHKTGLKIPKEVRTAVDEYRSENDGIGAFLREKCVRDPQFSTPRGAFTKAIQVYCVEKEFHRPSNQEINDRLREEGFMEGHTQKGDIWKGISISPETEAQGDA